MRERKGEKKKGERKGKRYTCVHFGTRFTAFLCVQYIFYMYMRVRIGEGKTTLESQKRMGCEIGCERHRGILKIDVDNKNNYTPHGLQ